MNFLLAIPAVYAAKNLFRDETSPDFKGVADQLIMRDINLVGDSGSQNERCEVCVSVCADVCVARSITCRVFDQIIMRDLNVFRPTDPNMMMLPEWARRSGGTQVDKKEKKQKLTMDENAQGGVFLKNAKVLACIFCLSCLISVLAMHSSSTTKFASRASPRTKPLRS